MAINEANLKRQKDIHDSNKGGGQAPAKKEKKKDEKGKEPEDEGNQAEGAEKEKKKGGNKRKREQTVDKVGTGRTPPMLDWMVTESRSQEEEFIKKSEVKLSFPDLLKVQLVDDWEWITKEQKVGSDLAFGPIHDLSHFLSSSSSTFPGSRTSIASWICTAKRGRERRAP